MICPQTSSLFKKNWGKYFNFCLDSLFHFKNIIFFTYNVFFLMYFFFFKKI